MITLCAVAAIAVALLRISYRTELAASLATVFAFAIVLAAAVFIPLHHWLVTTAALSSPGALTSLASLTLALLTSLLISLIAQAFLHFLPRLQRQMQRERLWLFLAGAAAALLCEVLIKNFTPSSPISATLSSLIAPLTSLGFGLLFAIVAVCLACLRENSRLSSASAALPRRASSDYDQSRALLYLSLLAFCIMALAGAL